MEKDKKIIEVHDDVSECFNDCLNGQYTVQRHPKGFVEIYEKEKEDKSGEAKKLVGKSNLVLYQGREHIAQRLFNVHNGNIPQAANEYLSWFGIGSGGVLVSSPFSPISPTNLDTFLGVDSTGTSEIVISPSNAAYGDHRAAGYYKKLFDSVTFQQDASNEDKYLVTLVQVTLSDQDANGSIISEAGLFTASSSAASYAGPFNLFARVTFPSISKDANRVFIFNWFLYF